MFIKENNVRITKENKSKNKPDEHNKCCLFEISTTLASISNGKPL